MALINGVNYSWSNISFLAFGVPLIGITEITYTRKQKKENNYGAGEYPTSRGYGNYEYEGSITVYLDEWKNFIAAAPNRDPLQISAFNVPVVFGGSRVTANKDILIGVEFLEDPMDSKQGDTKIMVKIPLIIADISR